MKLSVVKALIAGALTMAEIADHVGDAPSPIYRGLPGGRSAAA